jgi:hypothetical protein
LHWQRLCCRLESCLLVPLLGLALVLHRPLVLLLLLLLRLVCGTRDAPDILACCLAGASSVTSTTPSPSPSPS